MHDISLGHEKKIRKGFVILNKALSLVLIGFNNKQG